MFTESAGSRRPVDEFVRNARIPGQRMPRDAEAAVMSLIQATLRSYSGSAPSADLEDLVSDVYVRFHNMAQEGRLGGVENVAGFLVVMTRRAGMDAWRRSRREATPLTGEDLEHAVQLADETDDFLALETIDEVASLLRLVRSSDDSLAYRVVTYMLDEVQATGTVPSQRTVGEALGVSHTAVAKALQRLRSLHGPRL